MERGVVSGRGKPEWIRRRALVWCAGGRCGRMRSLRDSGVVVCGFGMWRGRSGRERGKRIIRFRGDGSGGGSGD